MDTIPAIFLKDGGEFAGPCECGLVQENFLCIDVQQVAQPLQGDQDMGGGGRGRGEGEEGGGGVRGMGVPKKTKASQYMHENEVYYCTHTDRHIFMHTHTRVSSTHTHTHPPHTPVHPP